MTTIELAEYESRDVALTAAQARDVAAVAGVRLAVGIGAEPGTFRITATQHVGVVITPAVHIVIRPKVSLDNLFALLGVGLPPQAWQRERFAFETSRDLLAALSQFFARALQQATATGLLRSYRVEQTGLVALRGRIDLPEQIRHPARASTIACTFDEYTADVIENRLLKAATRRLLRVPGVPADARRLLRQALAAFEEVADVPVRADALDRIVFTRLNRHYEPALRLAQLVLRNLSLLDRVGANDASAFLVDMNELFQRYVTDRLHRALRGRLEVVAEPDVRLGTRREVAMAPDLVFRRQGQDVFAGDLKYKLTETGKGRSGDYYQLLAYLTALRLPAGVLIYCQASGEAPSRRVTVRHSGQSLLTYPLDLTGSNAALEGAVAELAGWIQQRGLGHADVALTA
jgi:5-methylcytosine-specific restriction enzyme subunit McrC